VAGASGAFIFINTASPAILVTVSNNMFNNISVNTTGSVTFVSHSYTMPAGATQTINNNQIVGGFSKTGIGNTITGFTSGALSPNGSNSNITNNNLSNITVTGATVITGISNSDGSGSSPNRTVTGNMFMNWTSGTGACTGMSFLYIGATSNISNNNISGYNSAGAVTGITITNSFAGGNPLTLANNTITGLVSTGSKVLGLQAILLQGFQLLVLLLVVLFLVQVRL
jgi:trimeric autotransporter adhesin